MYIGSIGIGVTMNSPRCHVMYCIFIWKVVMITINSKNKVMILIMNLGGGGTFRGCLCGVGGDTGQLLNPLGLVGGGVQGGNHPLYRNPSTCQC